MANLQAATTTRTAPTVTDPDAVRELLDEYVLNLNYELSGDSEDSLNLWGYGTFSPYIEFDNGEATQREVAIELLYRLSQYIQEGEKLVLRTGGFTKCRSVHSVQWTVYPHLVIRSSLGAGPTVVQPPDTLAEILSDEDLEKIGNATDPTAIDRMDTVPSPAKQEGDEADRSNQQFGYPDWLLEEVEEDHRISKLDQEDDFWEFEAEDGTSWRGSAGAVRAFAAGFDA